MYAEYYLTSIDPEQNRRRFYSITMQPALFGFSLTKHWGRIGTKGKKLTSTFDSMDRTNEEIKRLLQVREKHGYVRVR